MTRTTHGSRAVWRREPQRGREARCIGGVTVLGDHAPVGQHDEPCLVTVDRELGHARHGVPLALAMQPVDPDLAPMRARIMRERGYHAGSWVSGSIGLCARRRGSCTRLSRRRST